MSGPRMMQDPRDLARSSPHFKINHIGKATCTLCNIYCNDEAAFIKHVAGKTHTSMLERLERSQVRQQRLAEEETRSADAEQRAIRDAKTRELLLRGSSSNEGSSGTTGVTNDRFGLPHYSFHTEHDPVTFVTKVWLEFPFPHAGTSTRPLHRWLSSREQKMEPVTSNEDDEYYIYLLVACDGYTTASLKFPARAVRSQPGDLQPDSDEPAFKAHWDSLRRVYELFFTLTMQPR